MLRFRRHLPLALAALLAPVPARAIILYGADDTATTTDPGAGVPWDAVAKVTNAAGTSIEGSAVHIGHGYMITANHVALGTHVSFDGVTTLAIDSTFAPVRLSGGADAKIFKLTTVPAAAAAFLDGALEHAGTVALVGWGVGRDATALDSSVVGWGATATKRWGTNNFDNYSLLAPAARPVYDFLPTHLGQGTVTEAGLTRYDSGSGAFQFIDNRWRLVGIATVVTTRSGTDTSSFAMPETLGDENIFLRVSSYSAEIGAITAIPEPATYGSLGAGVALALAARRRHSANKARSRA